MEANPLDLDICAQEAIHVPGSIQGHGVLVGLDSAGLISYVSQNASTFFGHESGELLNTPFGRFVALEWTNSFEAALAAEDLSLINPVTLGINNPEGTLVCDLIMHRSAQCLIIEIEPTSNEELTFSSSFHRIRAASQRLNGARSLVELADVLTEEIAAITSFDRVMVYRFDPQWNGEVISEVNHSDKGSFFGLHFPASDIPAQARALYTNNWLRIIGDVGYEPVPLLARNAGDAGASEPLDLSKSVLRSVSPVHIEYLKNMGVTASMSVSLVVDGKLWGLIACHHYSGQRLLPYAIRSAAEFLGQSASLLIPAKEDLDQKLDRLTVQSVRDELHRHIARPDTDMVTAITRLSPSVLDLLSSSGVAICLDGTITSLGTTPDGDDLFALAGLLEKTDGWPLVTNDLSELHERFTALDAVAAGVIAYRTSLEPNNWIMWFRPEFVRTVTWAGDPTEKVVTTTDTGEVRLSPRKSFAGWQEERRGVSLPWLKYETDAAEDIARRIANHILRESSQVLADSRTLQDTLVKVDLPEVEGLSFACRYRPTRGRAIGGDWYDAIVVPNGEVFLSLGDVAGHGLSAASTMAQIRSALRAYWVEGLLPSDALKQLNTLVCRLMPTEIATGVAAAISQDRRTFCLASAGHLPAVLLRNGRATLITPPRSPALGVDIDVPYAHIDVAVQPGDLIMLYSDGLIEAKDRSLDDGMKILLDAAEVVDAHDLGAFCDSLMTSVPSITSDDDVAILVVRID